MQSRGRGRPPRAEVYQRFALAMDDMKARFGGLPPRIESETIWRNIWREDAHNSTAIEGNTLVQHEVDALLEGGVAAGRQKVLSEYLVVQGYANAAAWVYHTGIDPAGDWNTGELLTMHEVRYVHTLAMDLAWQVEPHEDAGPDEGAGSFRKHKLQPLASGVSPVEPVYIDTEMQQWIKEVQALKHAGAYPILTIAALHARFERIHPFIDGNGRTGRLLLNLILVRLGMPPAIIYKRDRDRYIAALKRADNDDPGHGRAHQPRRAAQPRATHAAEAGRERTTGADQGSRRREDLSSSPALSGGTRGAARHPRLARRLAQQVTSPVVV